MDLSGQIQTLEGGTIDGRTTNICIIGGGVSGLSALQVVMETSQYKSGLWKPILFEARDKTGGIW
jgi:cation diffusion facilitator CzcD-associated flavoprotein CzcO